ncbi:MAG: transposase [Pseudomonadota bacterium]
MHARSKPAPKATGRRSGSLAEGGGPRGYDAGKKTKGRKRPFVTDTEGDVLASVTHSADIHACDGAAGVVDMALGS